jgi:hypothetical protein
MGAKTGVIISAGFKGFGTEITRSGPAYKVYSRKVSCVFRLGIVSGSTLSSNEEWHEFGSLKTRFEVTFFLKSSEVLVNRRTRIVQ